MSKIYFQSKPSSVITHTHTKAKVQMPVSSKDEWKQMDGWTDG